MRRELWHRECSPTANVLPTNSRPLEADPLSVDISQNTAATEVAVIGLGYVGAVSAACLASMGHLVHGVDRDPKKVAAINEGRAPFFEPGLDELLRAAVSNRRLSAHTSMEEALRRAPVALICVGTPGGRDGGQNLDQLVRVCTELRNGLGSRDTPLVVAIRSTVFPGTCEGVVQPLVGGDGLVGVVSHPEFLREGSAVKDFLDPALIVIGADRPDDGEAVADLYRILPVEPRIVGTRSAELMKYASNAFHAVKIEFANEMGSLAARHGVDVKELMSLFCEDSRLNISRAYLRPGFAFGGSCLPKDLRALTHRGRLSGLRLPLLESILPGNDEHLQRSLNRVLESPAEKIGIVGIAFKENTDDLRESPAVTLVQGLLREGRQVRIFDPWIRTDKIYGLNLGFLHTALPGADRLFAEGFTDLVEWADELVVTQKLPAALAAGVSAGIRPVIDLTELNAEAFSDPLQPRGAAFSYHLR
jgi:GDP-mannose 6-dehydrogenase